MLGFFHQISMKVNTDLNMSCSLDAGIQCGSHCSDLRNLILIFKCQTLLAHLRVALSYCIRCQKKEEKMNLKMMHLIFHELFAFTEKNDWPSRFRFFWDALYSEYLGTNFVFHTNESYYNTVEFHEIKAFVIISLLLMTCF